MPTTFTIAFAWVIAAMNLILGVFALGRLVFKLRSDDTITITSGGRLSLGVLVTLALYALSRAISLAVAIEKYHLDNRTHGTMTSLYFTEIPAIMNLCLLCTAVALWSNNLRKASIKIFHTPYQVGQIAFTVCVAFTALHIAAAVCALVCWHYGVGLRSEDWFAFVALSSATAFFVSGSTVVALGVKLRQTWDPYDLARQNVSVRLFIVAVVFGVMAMFQGLTLFVFVVEALAQNKVKLWHSDKGLVIFYFFEMFVILFITVLLVIRRIPKALCASMITTPLIGATTVTDSIVDDVAPVNIPQ